jgi:hypothetical protein
VLGLGTCVLGAWVSLAQTASAQWLRSSVKELNEPDRSIFLGFLDECRKRSDFIANSLVSGDRATLVSQVSPEAMAGWEQVVRVLRDLKVGGARVDLTYRNQALENRADAGVIRMTSRVWYVIGDPAMQPPRKFVAVVLAAEAQHAGRAIAIETLSYEGDVPTWLLRVDGSVIPPSSRVPH